MQTPGISDAILGFNAIAGCDYTSSFNRKGKIKPFQVLESSDEDHLHVENRMRSLTSESDIVGI